MSDAAFREALDAYRDAVHLGLFTKFTDAARAEVVRIHREEVARGR